MPFQKIAIAAVVVAVAAFLIDYLFYGILMADMFTGADMRDPPLFGAMIVGYFFLAFPFVHFYSRSYGSGTKISEGAKYGATIALAIFVFTAILMYSLEPDLTMSMTITEIIYRIVLCAILGIIVALILGVPDDRGPGKPPPGGGGSDGGGATGGGN